MIRGEHSAHSILLRLSMCSMLVYMISSNHLPSVSTVVSLDSSLTQAISSNTLLSRFFFLLHVTLHCIPTSSNLELSLYILLRVQIDALKDSSIIKYSESDLIILCSAVYLLSTTIFLQILKSFKSFTFR